MLREMLPGEFHGTNVISLRVSHFRVTDTLHEPQTMTRRHSHLLPQICIVHDGSFEERLGTQRREIRARSAVLRPAGELHENRFHAHGARCVTAEIEPDWLANFEQQLGVSVRSDLLDDGGSAGSISDLGLALREEEPERSIGVEEALLNLMLCIARRLRAGKLFADGPRWLTGARDFIHAHLTGHLTVERVARAVSVHPAHLARTFRARSGETVGAYIRRARAERARDLIRGADMRLADVASLCGFADQSHMNRVVRRMYGVTPRAFRR